MQPGTSHGCCVHCQEPLPQVRYEDEDERFCCIGCQTIWHALNEAGMGNFYNFQDVPIGVTRQTPWSPHTHEERSLDAWIEHSCPIEPDTYSTSLHVDGLHCAGCVWLVEQMPYAVDGVLQAQLNLGQSKLHVVWDASRMTNPSQMSQWLGQFGYEASLLEHAQVDTHDLSDRQDLRRVGVAWAMAGNVMLLSAAHYSGLTPQSDPHLYTASVWVMWALTTLSLLYSARVILTRAWYGLKFKLSHWTSDAALPVDVPLALGVLIGWGASAQALWDPSSRVWLDSVAMLIAAVLTARWVQKRSGRAARKRAQQLLSVLPHTARRLGPEGPQQVDLDQLQPKDLVEVRAGEVIPVDGLVHEGAGQLNRSALTGESQAHPTKHGEHVEAGCVLISGHLTLIAQQVGDATRLGQLMAWIDSRQQERPKSIDRADRLSAWFVLIVLGAAALAWGIWSAVGHAHPLEIAVSVLVITCPCALGMATPLMLAMSGARAARRGIFIKHDYTLEQCAKVDTVVFDKTGVLTFGQPRVVDTLGDADALEWARALESRSGHPLAQAIGRKARALSVQVINETPGAGIEGTVEGHHVIAGRPAWVLEQVHDLGVEYDLTKTCEDWMTRGDSVVLCAIDGTPRALFGLRDPMRPEAPSIIQTMRDRGLETIILSGDHPHAVEHLAQPLGITRWYGGTSPEQKLEQILTLQAEGRHVMMVGDGVNDAAALQQAHVGVAVFGGTQASLAAADVFLTHEGIGATATLLQGAQRTSRALDGLILYAVLYNIAGLFAASFGHVSPLMAAIFMPLSSLTLLLATWGASRVIMTAPSAAKPSPLTLTHSKTEVLS